MRDKLFYGTTSNLVAKNAYVPVSEIVPAENLTLGKNTSSVFQFDPKHLGFTAAKHKFVGKMLEGSEKVLEIGCMDGFGSTIVASFVHQMISIDIYKPHVEEARKFAGPRLKNVEFRGMDFLDETFDSEFDGCFALDVLEHVDPEQEHLFLSRAVQVLRPNGVFIVGMPSLESQVYASEANKRGHINCQTAKQLTGTLKKYFGNVFAFGMNDEVLHTGYGPMCHYLMNLCTGPKK